MKPEELDSIIQSAKDDFAKVTGELHAHILEAAAAVLEDSQESDKKPKVTIALKLTLDLSHAPPAWHMEAAVGVRRKVVGETRNLEEETPALPGFES